MQTIDPRGVRNAKLMVIIEMIAPPIQIAGYVNDKGVWVISHIIKLRLIQINLNHCLREQDLLWQIITKNIDVAILNKPYPNVVDWPKQVARRYGYTEKISFSKS